MSTAVLTPADASDLALEATAFDEIVGGLTAELDQQRIGEQTAVLTGYPGLSTVHCLTIHVSPDTLPTL